MANTDALGQFTTLIDALALSTTPRLATIKRHDAESVMYTVNYTKGDETGLFYRIFMSTDGGTTFREWLNSAREVVGVTATAALNLIVDSIPYQVTDVRISMERSGSGGTGTVTVKARTDGTKRPVVNA